MRISDWSSDVCSSDLSQWWRQLSSAIVFGLTFATLLTLVVTPAALMLRAHVAAFRAGRREARRRAARSEARPAGKECVSACRSRWQPSQYTKNKLKDRTYRRSDTSTISPPQ